MPPSPRRLARPEVVTALTAQADVIDRWARDRTLAQLQAPSALDGWSVSDLLWHLVYATQAFTDITAASTPAEPIGAMLADYEQDAQGVAEQVVGHAGDPRPLLAEAVQACLHAAAEAPAVIELFGHSARMSEALGTRVLELVVHGDDLGIAPDQLALAITVRLLTGVLAEQHPGRAVELRVPPFSAVQVLEGTVHRRGTPSAVVEIEPLAWLRLTTGRASWAGAEAAGQVQASGERSDLSAYLPILR